MIETLNGQAFLKLAFDVCDKRISKCITCSTRKRHPYLRNTSEACRWCKAITTTERNIALAGDDVDWSLDHVWCGSSSTNGEELSHSDWLTGGKGKVKELWIEIARGEEVDVDTLDRCWSEVACWERSELRVGLGSAEVGSEQEL